MSDLKPNYMDLSIITVFAIFYPITIIIYYPVLSSSACALR